MKVVILAGGRGTRMEKLTGDTPKPLLKYKGSSLLEHKLEIVPESTKEIIIVVGYLGEKIKPEIGEEFNGIPIRYVLQKELLGTAHAIHQCKKYLDGEFIVLMGDDIYSKKDIEDLSKAGDWGLLIKENKISKESLKNKSVIEKILRSEIPDYTYTGACLLTPDFFSVEMEKISPESKEYGLPHTITKFLDERRISVTKAKDWIRITAPEDLE